MRIRIGIVVFALSIICLVPANGVAWQTEGVSPGSSDRIEEIEGKCPTFIWGGEPGALAFEVIVYKILDEALLSDLASIDLNTCEEVLYKRVPAGATAWQPALAAALEQGGHYVWFVRAILQEDHGEVPESGTWSEGYFFSISAVITDRELEEALSVVRRFMNQNDEEDVTAEAPSFNNDRINKNRFAGNRHAALPSRALKALPSATAAIKGAVPDATGETYGVVGISSSPDGAGVGAANTAGGPDLVLDGSEDFVPDTALRESGIDRAWGTTQTFNIQNSVGGGMTLQVDGVAVTTTDSDLNADKLTSGTVPGNRLSGSYSQPLTLSNAGNSFTGSGAGLTAVDADTLDGTDGLAYATDAETSALMSAHAGSADHDGRYFTETELSTSGGGGVVHWGVLAGVPAGFADDVDDVSTYTPGYGVIIDGDMIQIDPGAFVTMISTADSAEDVGKYSSVAIGGDGLGLISYFDDTNNHLKVARCDDLACTSATSLTLDSTANAGQFTSITIGADGFGLISYQGGNDNLTVAHCENAACSSATISDLGSYSLDCSIAMGHDDRGLISFNNSGVLKVAHCDNAACTSATITTIDDSGYAGSYNSITVGADGLGLISYSYDNFTFLTLKVARCLNAECTDGSMATIDSTADTGFSNSITTGSDGLGLITYSALGVSEHELKVAHCNTNVCSGATISTLADPGTTSGSISIAIGPDGFAVLSYGYYDSGEYDLMRARCDNLHCTSASISTLDSPGNVGMFNSIAVGVSGLELISYYDATNDDLKVVKPAIGLP